ncbi:MAG: class I tRNA ligase family protein, partial [archaeon]|nr:class I tRNA ligase family protein [archaeon]
SLFAECRALAARSVAAQLCSFRGLGVLSAAPPTSTGDPSSEAASLRALAALAPDVRYRRSLHAWCPSCQTSLSKSEVSTLSCQHPGCFVEFPCFEPSFASIRDLFSSSTASPSLTLSFVVWTAAPWSVAYCEAILVGPHADYLLVLAPCGRRALILDEPAFLRLDPHLFQIVGRASPQAIDDRRLLARNPLPWALNRSLPVRANGHVRRGKGTGVLHCAPSCSSEDYAIGQELFGQDLSLLDVFDESGLFLPLPGLELYTGLSVAEADVLSLASLSADGLLQPQELFQQSTPVSLVPSCWRCCGRVVSRCTFQYFLDCSPQLDAAVASLGSVKVLPSSAKATLLATLRSRPTAWLLSRNRVWGVPIPAFVCRSCDRAHLCPDFIRFVADRVAESGIEWYFDPSSLPQMLAAFPAFSSCASCHSDSLRLEHMTLDVFFESALTLQQLTHLHPALRSRDVPPAATILIEGHDQHRGFFASSLLMAHLQQQHLQLDPAPPLLPTAILAHGFILQSNTPDKLSKSSGCSGVPEFLQIDVLRAAVLVGANGKDFRLSNDCLYRAYRRFKQIRQALGFLVNLLATSQSLPQESGVLDRYLLSLLHHASERILAKYDNLDFNGALDDFGELLFSIRSGLAAQASPSYSCLATLSHALVSLVAPVYSFLAEELYEYLSGFCPESFLGRTPAASVHLTTFLETMETLSPEESSGVSRLVSVVRQVSAPPQCPKIRVSFASSHQNGLQLHTFVAAHPELLSFMLKIESTQLEIHLCDHLTPEEGSFFWPKKSPWVSFSFYT